MLEDEADGAGGLEDDADEEDAPSPTRHHFASHDHPTWSPRFFTTFCMFLTRSISAVSALAPEEGTHRRKT